MLNSPGVLEPLAMAVPEPLPASKYSRLEIYRALPRPKNVNIVGARSTQVFELGGENGIGAPQGLPGTSPLRQGGFKTRFPCPRRRQGYAPSPVALREPSRSVLMRSEGSGGPGGGPGTRHRFIWRRPTLPLPDCTIMPHIFQPFNLLNATINPIKERPRRPPPRPRPRREAAATTPGPRRPDKPCRSKNPARTTLKAE